MTPGTEDSGTPDVLQEVRAAAFVTRAIGLALLAGVAMLVVVILMLRGFRQVPIANAGIMAWLGVVAGVGTFVASYVVPGTIAKAKPDSLSQASTEELIAAFQTKAILGMALAEGGAILNVVVYFLEGQVLNLGVVALLATRLAIQIPSAAALEYWIRSQQQVMNGPGATGRE